MKAWVPESNRVCCGEEGGRGLIWINFSAYGCPQAQSAARAPPGDRAEDMNSAPAAIPPTARHDPRSGIWADIAEPAHYRRASRSDLAGELHAVLLVGLSIWRPGIPSSPRSHHSSSILHGSSPDICTSFAFSPSAGDSGVSLPNDQGFHLTASAGNRPADGGWIPTDPRWASGDTPYRAGPFSSCTRSVFLEPSPASNVHLFLRLRLINASLLALPRISALQESSAAGRSHGCPLNRRCSLPFGTPATNRADCRIWLPLLPSQPTHDHRSRPPRRLTRLMRTRLPCRTSESIQSNVPRSSSMPGTKPSRVKTRSNATPIAR